MRIYISGKISNVPQGNKPKFELTENYLRFKYGTNAEILNPHNIAAHEFHDKQWHNYMRVDLRYMLACNQLVVLDDWKKSRGAIIEVLISSLVLIPIYSIDTGVMTEVKIGFITKVKLAFKLLLNIV